MADKKEYGDEFLYAEDLIKNGDYQAFKLRVAEVIPPNTLTAANKQKIPHYTLRFEGAKKLLVICSRTNAKLIKYATKKDVANCVGEMLTLQVNLCKMVGAPDSVAIRINPHTEIRRGVAN